MKCPKIATLLALGLLLTVFLSCSKDENNLKSPLVGTYELLEYHSNMTIDLNGDGIKSYDLLDALDDFYFSRMRSLYDYDLEISDYFSIRMYAMLPEQMANDPTPHSGTFGNVYPAYELVLSDDLQTILNFEMVYSHFLFPSELKAINIIETGVIQLISDQSFYCYVDYEWKRIETRAVFRKL